MRPLAWMILGIGAILATSPARAQTYNPNYPICLQTYGDKDNYVDCSYTSLPQCSALASGRAAQCLTNPYFVLANRRHPSAKDHVR